MADFDIAKYVAKSRKAQGLSRRISDAGVKRSVAQLLQAPGRVEAAGHYSNRLKGGEPSRGKAASSSR